jgi:tRNA(Arg) A34 adenosine deaminase TadA
VVCNNEIVGAGKCEDGTTGDVTDHAEMIALRKACRTLSRNRLNDCTIYTTNEPCPMCAAAIFQAKIPHVVIGLTRDDVSHLLRPRKIRIQDLANDSGYEVKIETGVLKAEILAAFQDITR